jgi:Dolichyl-phosphate-mannose-protein mannosyltransferase
MPSTTNDAPAVEAIGKKSLLVLLGILALAGVLRFHALGADSLWHDEIWSIEMTVGRDGQQSLLPETGVLNPAPDLLTLDPAVPWWEIWSHMRLDNHPPLYSVLLRFWREMFGSSESAVRSLSVVVSLIAILAMFDAARHFHGVRPALWAALLMALAAPQIQYAQETRSYALLLAEGMIAAAAVARLQQRGPTFIRAAILALAVTAMAITHYFAIGAIAALVIYTIIYLKGRSRPTTLAAFGCAFVLGVILWAHQFVIQWRSFASDSVSWLYDPSRHFLAVVFVRILLLPGRSLFDSTGVFQAASIILAIVFLVPLLARRRYPATIFWWLWLVGTIAPVAAEDLIHHYKQLGLIRYTLLATPAVYVLLATAAQWIGRPSAARLSWIIPAAAAFCCIVAIPKQPHRVWDWRRLADTINASRQPGELICLVGPCEDGFWDPDSLYAPLSYYLHPMPSPVVMMFDPPSGAPIPGPLTALPAPPGLWAIVGGSGSDTAWPPAHWNIDQKSDFEGIGTLEHLHHN